jgi:hypothetical protein
LCLSARADVAQLVEQRIRNAKVGGSTPLIGTNHIRLTCLRGFHRALLVVTPHP